MQHVLRQRMRAYLSQNRVGVLSLSGGEGTWAIPVRCRAENLDVDCLVPRWSDVAFHAERCPAASLVILSPYPSSLAEPLCWLQCTGKARPVDNPDWRGLLPKRTSEGLAEDLYLILRLVPARIDLLDESQGWGARETLEIEDARQ